jgi:hypothetical protein
MVTQERFDKFTLEYHKQALYMARQESAILERAGATLARWESLRANAPIQPLFPAWKNLLAQGVDVIEHTVCNKTESAAELRKNSPFAGILPPEQRLALLQHLSTS